MNNSSPLIASMKNRVAYMPVWEKRVVALAIFLCVLGFAAISVYSLIQTEQAVDGLKDPNVVIFGFPLGMYFPWAAALVIQYGQNLALYIKHNTIDQKQVMWTVPFLEWKITAGFVCDLFFFMCATIDAATNIIWYRGLPSYATQSVLAHLIISVFLAACVFVEELMGKSIGALAHVLKSLGLIREKQQHPSMGGLRTKTFDERAREAFSSNPPRVHTIPGASPRGSGHVVSNNFRPAPNVTSEPPQTKRRDPQYFDDRTGSAFLDVSKDFEPKDYQS